VNGEVTVEGYAALFGIADRSGDVVAPGAFRAGLRRLRGGLPMLFQHKPEAPVGLWDRIGEDGHGLFVRGRLVTGAGLGRDLAALVAAGAVTGLSIGFRTVRAQRGGSGGPRRILEEIELWEVSLVTFPMQPGARLTPLDSGPGAALRGAATAMRAA
jgi:hypothetical protein